MALVSGGAVRGLRPLALDREQRDKLDKRLRRLVADPLQSDHRVEEYGDYVRHQFERVWGVGRPPDDAGGPIRTDIEPYRPEGGLVRLAAPVGPDERNHFADVYKVQKALSRTGDFHFDIVGGEKGGALTDGLGGAIKGFQAAHGLAADGRLAPDGAGARPCAVRPG